MVRRLLGLCVACLLLAAVGCKKDKDKLVPDPDFSINVMGTPAFWPREDKDFPADEDGRLVMEATLEDWGRPEVLRVIWTPDRRIMRQREMVESLERDGAGLQKPEFEWVYIDKMKVLRFRNNKVEERDLDARLLKVCEQGDPNEVKIRKDPQTGLIVETFIYYGTGQILYFDQQSGALIREDQVTPTPGMVRRL
jgi:hypothetical protein